MSAWLIAALIYLALAPVVAVLIGRLIRGPADDRAPVGPVGRKRLP